MISDEKLAEMETWAKKTWYSNDDIDPLRDYVKELVAEVRMLRALLETQSEVTSSARAVDLALREPSARQAARVLREAADDGDFRLSVERAARRLLNALGWDDD